MPLVWGPHSWEPQFQSFVITSLSIWQIISPSSAIPKAKRLQTLNVFPWRLAQFHWAAKPYLNWGEAIYSLSLSPGGTVHTVCRRNINMLDYRGCPRPFWGVFHGRHVVIPFRIWNTLKSKTHLVPKTSDKGLYSCIHLTKRIVLFAFDVAKMPFLDSHKSPHTWTQYVPFETSFWKDFSKASVLQLQKTAACWPVRKRVG